MPTSLLIVATVLVLGGSPVMGQPSAARSPISTQRMELLRMWRLVDELEIDEAQAEKLFPVWSRHRRLRDELRADRKRLTDELGKLLDKEDVEDAALEKQIGDIRALDRKSDETKTAMQKDIAQLLTVRQQARLLLFDESFRGDLREIVRMFRRGPSSGRRGPRSGSEWPGPPWDR